MMNNGTELVKFTSDDSMKNKGVGEEGRVTQDTYEDIVGEETEYVEIDAVTPLMMKRRERIW